MTKETILIVEDSPTQVVNLRFLLENEGFQVTIATDGLEALRMIERSPPDLIVSDVLMPGLDGFQLCARLKLDPRFRELPVILLTSLSDPQDVIKGLESGADNFIMKPFEPGDLLARMNLLLKRRQAPLREVGQMGVNIFFAGQEYTITSDRKQIVDFLLSIYELALRKNLELNRVQKDLETLNARLERLVTERTEVLEETRNYLENLFSCASGPIVVWSPDLTIIKVNPAFEHLTGIPQEESLGMHLGEVFPPESRDTSLEAIQQIRGGESREIVVSNRSTGGKRTVLWSSAGIPGADGRGSVATIAQGQDITERKQAEEALQRSNADLARSNRELEQFAYVASHDLQEPLRMVASYTQLLADRYGGQLDQDAQEFIGFAVDGARRMQGLIQDLLAFSRVATKGRPFTRVPAGESFQTALANLHSSVQETGATITHGRLPVIVGDGSQLALVFQNLLANCIKFRKPEEKPLIQVEAEPDPEKSDLWRFLIRDNGIGIDPRLFPRLFVLFQRLHTKAEFPGSGIGLALCKRIIERHGGRIWLESEPGKGTTVFFTVPAAEEGKEPSA